MSTELYHFWSNAASQRIRMALKYKCVAYTDIALSYWDDETFFKLGLARKVPILKIENGKLLIDSEQILWEIDNLFPTSSELVEGVVDQPAWTALLNWRYSIDSVLNRLVAPALLSYRDIAQDANSIAQYKQGVLKKYGMSAEALASDRFASYEQFSRISHINELAKHLAQNRYYLGRPSIADILIAADLYPIQCLDGVSLPIDFLYYLQRVEQVCNIDLKQGLLISI